MSHPKSHPNTPRATRRDFLAGGALLGFGAVMGAASAQTDEPGAASGIIPSSRPDAPSYDTGQAGFLLSSCLQCNTGCGIRVRIDDGVATKIDGNPYNPLVLSPHIPYDTGLATAANLDGAICPKGQAGLQTAYDPYRLRRVLKRVGQRGENRWASIPFEQAIQEICEGGKLFADVPGEADRHVQGLRELAALRDAEVAKAMAADVQAIFAESDATKKSALVASFRVAHGAHLDTLIDPEHPDLGPRNNQIVVAWGRIKDGRGTLYRRFAAGLGTTNAHGHTTVCQGSLYFTCKAISEQYQGGKFTGGQKFYWQADTANSEFILAVGANLFEANYGPPNRTARLTERLASGQARLAVVDPRFGAAASKAWRWLPIRPGTDAALALAFIRWMLDNERYDARFLACANKAAATAAGEPSFTNATWLVEIKNGRPGKFVRAADIGIAQAETRTDPKAGEYTEKFMVVAVKGVLAAVDPNDVETPVEGDLLVTTTLPGGAEAKSGLQILADAAGERSFEEWCEIADVDPAVAEEVVRELTSHGKKAAVDVHRGASQHTNGFYNVLAWMNVNMLLGNFDARGGMLKASAYDVAGKGKGELHDLTAHPDKVSAFGVSSIRHELPYEKSTLFSGYPAKRPWYPLASDVYEEIIPSIGDAYPYPVKALFLYMGTPAYALPAGHTTIETLRDTEKLPLFVVSDIIIGTTSMYADYVFPDLSYLERWEFQGSHPNIPEKIQPVRQPVIGPITEDCTVFGQQVPISFEALLLGIAEQLSLPGFGLGGLGVGKDLSHPDDLYLRATANIAFGEKPDGTQAVPDADAAEIEAFVDARRHLPAEVFDAERWRGIVGPEMWPKVVYVLNRGGRFQDHAKAFNGERCANAYGALLNLYQEKTATTIHSGTGVPFLGHAAYLPIADFLGREPTALREGYDLQLITHRTITQTKSRTVANPWLSIPLPANGIAINSADAARLGLKNGQAVRVVSATNPKGMWPLGPAGDKPIIGTVIVTEGIRPGVATFALGFGHWATGATGFTIDGTTFEGEPRRAAGVHANAAMWTDPALGNMCMFDPVGGSVSFYDTHIRLEPVG